MKIFMTLASPPPLLTMRSSFFTFWVKSSNPDILFFSVCLKFIKIKIIPITFNELFFPISCTTPYIVSGVNLTTLLINFLPKCSLSNRMRIKFKLASVNGTWSNVCWHMGCLWICWQWFSWFFLPIIWQKCSCFSLKKTGLHYVFCFPNPFMCGFIQYLVTRIYIELIPLILKLASVQIFSCCCFLTVLRIEL